ncbi:MAG: type II toxin-antitoxin system ParD family antitoxin [Pirellula sp.]
MSTISITLPESVLDAVTQRAKSNGFDSVEDFVALLISQIHLRQMEVEELALQGWDSGPSQPWDKSEIDAIREKLRSKYGG